MFKPRLEYEIIPHYGNNLKKVKHMWKTSF